MFMVNVKHGSLVFFRATVETDHPSLLTNTCENLITFCHVQDIVFCLLKPR